MFGNKLPTAHHAGAHIPLQDFMSRVVDEVIEEALRELADTAVQNEMWRASTGPRVSSFFREEVDHQDRGA